MTRQNRTTPAPEPTPESSASNEETSPSQFHAQRQRTASNKVQLIDTQTCAVHHNGFAYHRTGRRKGIAYYRCAEKRKYKCCATIRTLADGKMVANRHSHNHAPKPQKTPSILNKKKLVYNGYIFHKHFENSQKTHWRCIQSQHKQCTVRLHTDNFGNIKYIRGVHNHDD